MQEFWLWFSTGFEHIIDWHGYDHILYIIALCIMFTVEEWRKLLMLITSFTIGHSLTLAASTSNWIIVKQAYIEILIPLTIVITCIVNIISLSNKKAKENGKRYTINYLLALVFGFIHGMGFSYLLKSMLGKEEDIVYPLLSFNLGLETGQIIIVFVMLLISIFLTSFTGFRKPLWVRSVSIGVLGISVFLFVQRIYAI